jgi:23S rRNA pseudouridine1911/1915/1917 synthase
MVVAKSEATLSRLTKAFQQRCVEKRYLALVHGQVTDDDGRIAAPIGRDAEQRPRWGVRPEGRPAETRFRVVERLPHATLLEMEPLTGRTNQLRIHATHIGHPILGDPEFGREAAPQPAASVVPAAPRLFLHAAHLSFAPPATRAWLAFNSPLPPEMADYLQNLRSAR